MTTDPPPACLSNTSWILLVAVATFVAAGLWLARDAILELFEARGHDRFVAWLRSHPALLTVGWRVIPVLIVLGIVLMKVTSTGTCG